MTEETIAAFSASVTMRNVRIPMRDGVALEADITFPSVDGATSYPGPMTTLLLRTPYNRAMMSAMPFGVVATAAMIDPAVAAKRGYAVIYQDVRGTFAAAGELEPMLNEGSDGVDTLAWIKSQPWSDGHICTFGPSYMGGAQMLLAAENPEELCAMYVQAAATDQFKHDWVYTGGVLSLEVAIWWSLNIGTGAIARLPEDIHQVMVAELSELAGSSVDLVSQPFITTPAFSVVLEKLLSMAPVRDLPFLRHLPWWHKWIDNRDNPDHFKANEIGDKLANIGVPVLHVGGWYDLFLRNTISHFTGITNEAPKSIGGAQRMIIGPWSHSDCIDCPPGATVDGQAMALAWMDYCVRGVNDRFFDHNVLIYIQGENRWRAEESWPLPGTERTRYYFHSDGSANTADGDGVLSTAFPGAGEVPDIYLYDPANPVPSKGGIGLFGSRAAHNEVEARADVLCYTTETLEQDVEVTGEVSATLYAATSAMDTDWWVRLIDVAPDGTAFTLNHGVLRARYRKSRIKPEAVTPGEITPYAIAMQATSNVFKRGHRIRLEVTSSCFPLNERNPNAYVDLGTVTEGAFNVAEQTVYHSSEHASYVELPIIPAEREKQWIETPFPLASNQHAKIPF